MSHPRTGAAAFLLFACVCAAAPHRFRVYPNPEIKIFAIAEDRERWLWLAAADGLYRFDGFHYQKIPEYPFASARFIAATADGSIWIADYQGFARFRDGKFDVLLRKPSIGMAAQPDRVFLRVEQSEFVEARTDGSMRSFRHMMRRDLTVDAGGRIWGVCIRPDTGCWLDPLHPESSHPVPLPGPGYQAAARDAQGRLWAATDTRVDLVSGGRALPAFHRAPSRETNRSGPLLSGKDGQIWFIGEAIRGVSPEIAFEERGETALDPVLAGFEDSRGRVWASYAGRGLVEWVADAAWQRWPAAADSGEIFDTVVLDRGETPLLATHKNLYRLDRSGTAWRPLAARERRYDSVLPLPDGGFLACIRGLGVARLSPSGQILERLRDLGPDEQYRKLVRDGKGRIWVASKRVLLRIIGTNGSLRFEEHHLPGPRDEEFEHAVDIELDSQGRPWVGYMHGIAWLDDAGRWRRIATDRPVGVIRSIALGESDIWISHRRPGGFSRLHRTGAEWRVSEYTAAEGYGPADTHFIKRDSRGWLWRGTPDGVYVSDGIHLATSDWLHISSHNGLAGDDTAQYGFAEDLLGNVWICTEQGLTRLRPDASWFGAPEGARAPRVTRVEADGQSFSPDAAAQGLPPGTRLLKIEAGSLDASPFRDEPLRYRMHPGANQWSPMPEGSLEIRNPREGTYRIEIAHAGMPGGAGSYSLRIGDPPAPPLLTWRWVGAAAGILTLTLLLRMGYSAPAFERPRFRIERALFHWRRRLGGRKVRHVTGSPEMSASLLSGAIAGPYRLNRVISRGGFSVVYEASHLQRNGERYAVKVLIRGAATASWVRDRFAHEVAALRSLRHPNVVPILDSWVGPQGELCIAMPFLDGITLRAVLEKAPPPPRRAARLLQKLGDALGEVHSRGIVHRDLKPENIILLHPETEREEPVIIDFGTAGLRGSQTELAATTWVGGSFHYMAPERLTGQYSPAADVYSLGIMLLEMLTGKRLFEVGRLFSDPGFQTAIEELLAGNGEVDAIAEVARRLVPAFDPDPRLRPADVRAWSADIAAVLCG